MLKMPFVPFSAEILSWKRHFFPLAARELKIALPVLAWTRNWVILDSTGRAMDDVRRAKS
jgi:hypothetical protein